VIFCLGHGWLSYAEWADVVYHDPRISLDA
jgi:hypothetical protein